MLLKSWDGFTLWMVALFLLALCSPGLAGEPPMVKRHIFSPDDNASGGKGAEKSPLMKRLEREILFTGVIISPHGREALIQQRTSRRQGKQQVLHKVGDEVAGMTIKKIGSNFIVLAGGGKEVRLNLYQGNKKRPAPPALPKIQASSSAKASPGKQPSASVDTSKQPGKRAVPAKNKPGNRRQAEHKIPSKKTKTTKPTKPGQKGRSNPFLEALQRALKNRGQGGTAAPSKNPFLEAIKKAQGK